MKKIIIYSSFILSILSFSLTSSKVTPIETFEKERIAAPKAANSSKVLKIYNCEDYIYEQDTDEDPDDLIEQFKTYYEEKYGQSIEVVYDCYDTNESMLSELKTGKTNYDLICCSDYTIQRMINDDLVIPFDDNATPNYNKYVSKYLTGKLDNIACNDSSINVNSYARGYMWGTLGLLYNPTYSKFSSIGEDTVREDMNNWLSLWDCKYKNTISIKDSMRDTYSVGIMSAYDTYFKILKTNFETGIISKDEYTNLVTEQFNKCDEKTVSKVLETLEQLKSNIFGFEVDSGKDDIQKGLIGINLAWSGDAVYAMNMAEEQDNPLYLEYKIPETGGNIWFDGWVMPKDANNTLAQEFVDFLSIPNISVLNMDYIGYTSFMAGDAVLDYVLESYDVSEDTEIEDKYDRDLTYFFTNSLETHEISDAKFKIEEENRQFDASYPTEENLPHLAVMDDFKDNLPYVMAMWEKLKGTSLSLGFYITLGVIFAGSITGVICYKVIKSKERKRRLARRTGK